MPAEPSSSEPESIPNLVVLPPAGAEPLPEPTPSPVPSGLPPVFAALARNPLVLAGGAVVAGVVLSRFMATPSARKIARELAAEAIKQLRPAATGAAGMAGTAAAGTLLEKGIEKYGPQIADYGKKMLADLLKKKE
jgi:hypothetical protein